MTPSSQPTNSTSTLAHSGRHLALFGATGGVGRQTVELALRAGYRVTALARDPARLDIDDPRLEVVRGDATDPVAVRQVLRGVDGVVVALGAPALSRSRVRSEGTRRIVAAMESLGIRRLMCVSVLGAGDSRASLPFFLRYLFFPLYLRRAVAEHEAQERVLQESGVDWTVVRPPALTDGPRTGSFAHGFGNDEDGLTLKISRADVAGFMLSQLGSDEYLRRTVGVSYRT